MRRPVPTAGGAGNYRVAQQAMPGLEGAEALNQAGQQSQQIGGMLWQLGEQLDTAAAQEALNQIKAKRQELTYDPEKGFQRFKGGDVMKPGPGGKALIVEMPEALDAETEAVASKLLSPRAKGIFRRAAENEKSLYKRDMTVYFANETEKYEAATLKDGNLTDMQEILQVFDDPVKVAAITAGIERRTRSFYEKRGLPGDAAATAASSNALRAVIESQAASGNGSQALAMFQRFGPKLDAGDRLALMPTIRTVQVGETARSQAQILTDSTYNGRTRAYESGAMESNKLGSGAFGPYQFMPGTWADVRAKNPDLNLPPDMRTATFEQHEAAHERFKAGNAKALRSAGFEPTPANLYLAHRFGTGGAEAVLRANPSTPLSSVLPANWQDQNPDMRGQTAGSFRALAERRYAGVTDTGIKADPLQASVDRATGVDKPKDGPLYRDTRQMTLDADIAYDVATRRNAEINAGNDAQRRATQSQLDLNLAEQKRQIDMAKLNLEIAVDKWMTAGGPAGPDGQPSPATKRPPPEIWNQLSYTKQQSIDATIAHNAKGQDVVTDQRVWYEIQQGLTSADPETRSRWANSPLWEYKRFLSNGDFQELSKIQSASRAGDPNKQLTRILNANQMIDDTLLTLGVGIGASAGKTDAEKANNFRRLAQQQITAFEVEQKRSATPEEQRKIIDRLAMPTFLSKGTLWGENTKPAYEITITDIPATEREKIVEALKSVGRPVTDDAVVDLYRRNPANARPKK